MSNVVNFKSKSKPKHDQGTLRGQQMKSEI